MKDTKKYDPTVIPTQPGWKMVCAKFEEGEIVGLNYFDVISWLICPYNTIDGNGITACAKPISAGDSGDYKVLKTPEGEFLGNFEYYFKNEEEIIEMYKEMYKEIENEDKNERF